MKNLYYKKFKLTLAFLFLVSAVQIIIIPMTKTSFQKIIIYPLPEGMTESFIINLCEKNFAKNISLNSILGYICKLK